MRSRFLRLFFGHFIILLVLLFQNCSGGGFSFTSNSMSPEDRAAASSAPTLSLATSPEALTNSRSFDFKFSVTTNKFASVKSVSCVLDANPAQLCASGLSTTNLIDGDHTLKVKAEDSLGNISDEVVVLWKVDATKPVVTINQAPSAVSGSANLIFAFSSNEVASFLCAMDAEAMAPCVSPMARTVTEGNHDFKVQSVDMAKNRSDAVMSTFKVDLTAPVINLVTKPASPTNSNAASFTFNGTDDGMAITVFSCKLDNQAAAVCNAGAVSYTALSDGAHTLSLSGQDAAGNMSAAVTFTWMVDTTVPSVPLITANVTSPTKNNAATFSFTATDFSGVKGYECQLDAGAITACVATGASYMNLTSGAHTFKVRAIDVVNNSSTFASFAWTVDLTAPVVTLTQTPASLTNLMDASFAFTATDVGSGIKSTECQLDAGAFAACTSPKAYTALALGTHTFNLRVKDQVDNTTTQSFNWSIVAAATPTPTPTPTPVPTATPMTGATVSFPLHIENGKRYLLDANNNPFFFVGDTPWSLEVALSQADVIKYLDNRKQKGFNTLMFELIEYCFTFDSSGFNCGTPGKTYYGTFPFMKKSNGNFDFTQPIEIYWQHVDFVMSEVAKRNMLILVTPSYVGYGGGNEGWYQEMIANGPTAMRTYGQFVGQRYKNFNNIIWVEGGDYNVADKDIVRAVVNGIRDILPNSLHTYHGSRFTPSSDFLPNEAWLGINSVYTDSAVASNKSSSCYNSAGCGALEIYARTTKPFFFIEGIYEGEGNSGQGTRSQAYQAVLSGAMGQLMGNSPIWYFNSGWQQALNSEGSISMGILAKIFAPLKWWLLIPDASGIFLTNQKNRVNYPAAYASDGSFSMVYFTAGTLTINTNLLGGTKVNAYTIDPFNGTKSLVAGSPFAKSSASNFTKSGSNSIGDSDWILQLEAVP